MKDWQRIGQDTFQNIGRRQIVERQFQEPGGEEIHFALFLEALTSCVTVVTGREQVVLLRQYRPGPERALDELPGGAVEEGESPMAAAHRKVLEKVGYGGDILYLGQSYSCAYSTRVRHHFLMPNAEWVQEPRWDPDERQQGAGVVVKPRVEFMQQVNHGLLTDGETALRAMRRLGW